MQLAMIGLGRMGGNMARRPTYAALRLLIDNWRWQGVPFFLRSGKRMPRRVIEIAIQFRQPPHLMFPLAAARSDGVEAAWRVVDPLIEAWEQRGPEGLSFYPAGKWGPAKADELIARDGASWRTP
jgi:glucose-6-phosphate 1-dehydrogenase